MINILPRHYHAFSSLVCFLVLVSPTLCQEHHSHELVRNSGPVFTLLGGVDGSAAPELIPDLLANRLFFDALAEPLDPSPLEEMRQRAKLSRAHLTETDFSILHNVLARYLTDKAAIAQSITSGTNSDRAKAYDARLDDLTTATLQMLKTSLSMVGLANLQRLVQSEKTHMAFSPLPAMRP